MTTPTTLTESQFSDADDAVNARLRGSVRGTPERDAANALSAAWEAVNALPVRTFAQRQERLAAICAFASTNGLVSL